MSHPRRKSKHHDSGAKRKRADGRPEDDDSRLKAPSPRFGTIGKIGIIKIKMNYLWRNREHYKGGGKWQ